MTEKRQFAALEWVISEIKETLLQAQRALEVYSTDPDDASQLRFCVSYIHQVYGTLHMIEFHGAAMLAEEMELVARDLSDFSTKQADDANEVLMRAILQLPDYLEHIKKIKQDQPTFILPVLNDLRAVRGAELLSEATFFSPDLSPAYKIHGTRLPLVQTNEQFRPIIAKLREMYHYAASTIIHKDEGVEESLAYLNKVTQRLMVILQGTHRFSVWQIANALVEGLAAEIIKPSASVKNLLKRLSQELKDLYQGGIALLDQSTDSDILKNLLYYIACTKESSSAIDKIKSLYSLDSSLQVSESDEQNLNSIADVTALKSVAVAIKAEIDTIKEKLDACFDQENVDSNLSSIEDTLKRVSDTLAVLGVASLRQKVTAQVNLVKSFRSQQSPLTDEQLMHVARNLMEVEDSIDNVLEDNNSTAIEGNSRQLDNAQISVLQESRNGLERIKDAFVEYLGSNKRSEKLADVPGYLREVRGGLSMIKMHRPAAILEGCASYIDREIIRQEHAPDLTALDCLADAIAGVDYYLECELSSQHDDNTGSLAIAESKISALGYSVKHLLPEDDESAPVPSNPVESDATELSAEPLSESNNSEYSEDTALASNDESDQSEPTMDEEATPSIVGSEPANAPQTFKADIPDIEDAIGDEIDEEIVEIFIEEAGEVLDTINEYLPQWLANTDDTNALTECRRAFHTLKGSGRMVGAHCVGELAWSIENMFNRIIDNSIEPDPVCLQTVQRVVEFLPSMVTAFEALQPCPDRQLVANYMYLADALSKKQPVSEFSDAILNPAPVSQHSETNTSETLLLSEPELIEEQANDQVIDINSLDEPSQIDLEANLEALAADDLQIQDESDLSDEPFETLESEATDAAIDTTDVNALKDEPEADALPEGMMTSNDDGLLDAEPANDHAIDESEWQLLEIFTSETESHLVAINNYIKSMEAVAPEYEPPGDDMQAALHTLKGSAYMAEVMSIASLVSPLECFTKDLRSYQVAINDDILHLLRDSVTYIQLALEQIKEGRFPEIPKLELFIARVDELYNLVLNPIIRRIEEEGSQRSVDPAMLEVIMAEEMDLLISLDLHLEEWREHGATSEQWQAVADELENVQNGAERAILPSMYILCQELSAVYGAIAKGKLNPDASHFDLLLESHNDLLATVDAVAAGQNLPELSPGLINRLRDVINSIESSDLASDTDPQEHLEQAEHKQNDSVQESHSESIEIDAHPTDDQPVASIQDEPVSSKSTSQHTDYDSFDLDDVDEETLEIFLEEAVELSDEIEEAVQEWVDAPEQTQSNEQLQRVLHTLKGGARLTGLTHIGDLAHDFETFIIELGNNQPEDSFFSELHQYQDKVLKAIEQLTSPTSSVASESAPVASEPERSPSIEAVNPDVESKIAAITNVSDSLVSIDSLPEETHALATQPTESIATVPFNPKVVKDTSATSAASKRNGPQEVVKLSADLLENLVNLAGETSISRARMEEQVSDISYSIDEMGSTVQRLQDQLRRLDIETEAQVVFRKEQMVSEQGEFDPLEMDRYSQLQQLSRSLIESASDLMDLKSTLVDKTRDAETVLIQQSRVNTELQENLMRSRMVPFSRMVPRLRRIVRQVSTELGKEVNFEFDNTEGELDRSMLERMVAPFEHMLRNAVDHGIESKERRLAAGKSAAGTISLSLSREGGDVLIYLKDDGGGIDLHKVRTKAIERKLMDPDAELSDKEVLQFILHAGFSTAESVTQISGRGVGMDVVYSEIKQLGGNMKIDSEAGQGTSFTIRLPFTVSVNRALMVMIGDDRYAVPLNAIEGIVRISPYELEHYYNSPDSRFEYAGERYQVRYLGSLLNQSLRPKLEGQILPLPVLLIRSSDHVVALQVDHLQGSREIVVKSLGAQFANVQGLSGATIMGDGHVVVILDLHATIRQSFAHATDGLLIEAQPKPLTAPENPLIMVVDDSVTVRKVTTRLLEREGFDVITAKDGVDAMAVLQDARPHLMLLDIEMPRMDGFEVAKNVRSSDVHSDLPIIMITSRTGEKHRQRGLSLGVNEYMGKPYQEDSLLEAIRTLIKSTDTIDA